MLNTFDVHGGFMILVGVLNALASIAMICSLKKYFKYFYSQYKCKIVVGACIQSMTLIGGGVFCLLFID